MGGGAISVGITRIGVTGADARRGRPRPRARNQSDSTESKIGRAVPYSGPSGAGTATGAGRDGTTTCGSGAVTCGSGAVTCGGGSGTITGARASGDLAARSDGCARTGARGLGAGGWRAD